MDEPDEVVEVAGAVFGVAEPVADVLELYINQYNMFDFQDEDDILMREMVFCHRAACHQITVAMHPNSHE